MSSPYQDAFNAVCAAKGETQVDQQTDTDWPSIEIVLTEHAKSQSDTFESMFGDALANYVAISKQAENRDGYRPVFNFCMLIGKEGAVNLTWR